jgi:hypothetical protein
MTREDTNFNYDNKLITLHACYFGRITLIKFTKNLNY